MIDAIFFASVLTAEMWEVTVLIITTILLT